MEEGRPPLIDRCSGRCSYRLFAHKATSIMPWRFFSPMQLCCVARSTKLLSVGLPWWWLGVGDGAGEGCINKHVGCPNVEDLARSSRYGGERATESPRYGFPRDDGGDAMQGRVLQWQQGRADATFGHSAL
jgi:hypothetical protein